MSDARIALVTGASRGIGHAIVNSLKEAGYFVVGTATSQSGADKISEGLGEKGCGEVLNLSDTESLPSLMARLKEQGRLPNILVCNAGINRDDLLLRMKQTAWDDVISVNLTGQYQLSKACIRPMMKQRWGRIVFVGSVVASVGNPGQANYCAAKAGVAGLARSVAREVASRGITVNVVAPGFIKTDMTDELSEEQVEMLMTQIPCQRLGQPQDVAEAVAYLVSDKAAYITGTTIHVNGGMFMN